MKANQYVLYGLSSYQEVEGSNPIKRPSPAKCMHRSQARAWITSVIYRGLFVFGKLS